MQYFFGNREELFPYYQDYYLTFIYLYFDYQGNIGGFFNYMLQ